MKNETKANGAGEGNDMEVDHAAVADSDNDAEEADKEDSAGKKPRRKKVVRYSDFCYTSKMEKLIEELVRIRDEDPSGTMIVDPVQQCRLGFLTHSFSFAFQLSTSAKSLIFSQFTSTLKWLELKLPEHGFQCRTLSGSMSLNARAKALHDFQNDPPTTLFLLSLGAGAVGINLTAANRIFLLEPSFNPAVEAQAIGRVHRLGQKRPVVITRLIMNDSVESRMRQVLKDKFGDLKANDAMVGSINNDKATIFKQEFDQLYGIRTVNEASDAVHPEQVASADLVDADADSDSVDADMNDEADL
jgi:SNF2 family DNA or RNA helicase